MVRVVMVRTMAARVLPRVRFIPFASFHFKLLGAILGGKGSARGGLREGHVVEETLVFDSIQKVLILIDRDIQVITAPDVGVDGHRLVPGLELIAVDEILGAILIHRIDGQFGGTLVGQVGLTGHKFAVEFGVHPVQLHGAA